jgi:hypothetical protein
LYRPGYDAVVVPFDLLISVQTVKESELYPVLHSFGLSFSDFELLYIFLAYERYWFYSSSDSFLPQFLCLATSGKKAVGFPTLISCPISLPRRSLPRTVCCAAAKEPTCSVK